MCGIAGALSLGAPINEDDRQSVRAMADMLRHRGPDDTGYFQDRRVMLGNSRLKIIDLSDKANLPMSNEDGTVWLAYNGEVTNFRELRTNFALDERHRFKSNSDTEVLVHLYEELGISFLDHLTGMFAFCLYDQARGKAYLARDFYGIRPLFTMRQGDRLYFASEIKSFFELPGFSPELDHEAIHHYFSLAYIPETLTPFKQVYEPQGGRLIEVDLAAGTHEERSYHEIRYEPDSEVANGDLPAALRDEMREAVRRNLISDAPLGLTLSGGVDTTSILALTRDLEPDREIHTFSIVMDEPSFNERRYQQIAVDRYHPIHHEIVVDGQAVAANLLARNAVLDEPSGDGAATPSYLLAQEATKYVSVLLSGEGGDEVFNAYETHLAYKIRKAYRSLSPAALRRGINAIVQRMPVSHRKLSLDFVAKRFCRGAEMGVPEAHMFWRHVLTEDQKAKLLRGPADYASTSRLFRRLFDRVDFADDLDRISLIDIRFFFIGDLMVKNDRTIMAHSIEARFPFMDRFLHEFVAKVPAKQRIKGWRRRYLEKEAMRPLLPPEIYKRPNMGLEMPHSTWFFGPFRPLAEKYFSKRHLDRSGVFDPAVVAAMWQAHLDRKMDNGRPLWCLLNWLIWFDLFCYDGDFRDHLPR
ncbi:MAG: asparagine synthase (glutamine-hydrolyzing) [Candidatus Lernaella stagnicola]|nr:asparagine synthase (glutamine-hydrolyzing) [Candidatus Lernaella stagnicola]